jgi:phosphotriesterase-related protein
MHVMTVTGLIDAEAMGITLPHEHLLLDLRNQFTEYDDPERRRRSHRPLGPDNTDEVRDDPYAVRDNLLLDDLDLAVREAQRFKSLGGRTIVDCTSVGIHRDARRLRELSLRTGLNVLAGCGYYTQDTHPPQMDAWSAEEITQQILRDLTEGIDGTDIKAGVIGELGTSNPLHPNERKGLVAGAMASRQTGTAIQVHTYPWGRVGLEAVDVLVGHGADPAKIVICHTDVEINLDYIRELLRRGVWVEFDNFGKEFNIPPNDRGFAGGVFARDEQRVAALKTLLDDGHARQLLLTNDICLKCMLHQFGGKGYDHILAGVTEIMIGVGIDRATIDVLVRDNPQRLYQRP